MSVIDLADNGFSYQEVSTGDVLRFAYSFDTHMEGAVGDSVLWLTKRGVARGEVTGEEFFDGVPVTLVRVAEVPRAGEVADD